MYGCAQWNERLRKLLLNVRDYWSPNYEVSPIPSDDEEIDESTLDKMMGSPTKEKLTAKGKGVPRKRRRSPSEEAEELVDDEEAEEESGEEEESEEEVEEEHEGTDQEGEGDTDPFVDDVEELRLAATDSLRVGELLISELVFFAIDREVNKRLFFVVNPGAYPHSNLAIPATKTVLWPLFYSNHFVMCVVHVEQRRFDVFDSLRDYAHAPRQHALRGVSTVVYNRHKVMLKPTLRHSEQQPSGSNDCGVFTINNALAIAGSPLRHTRKSLKALVKEM